jgi:exopolysaccharide biosynthesis protein
MPRAWYNYAAIAERNDILMVHSNNNTRVRLFAAIALWALLFCVLCDQTQAVAAVRKDAFLSQLLAARGFETQPDAQKNAAFILKSGIVTDPVDSLASPVSRRDALRWAIQCLGLSEEAKILADVNLMTFGLHFQDIASLTPFERGCLVVATRLNPALFNDDEANFDAKRNISQNEATALLGNVRSAARLMRLELKFSPAPGMEMEIFREGVFSDIPKWRVYVDGFDEKPEVDAMQKFFASNGFKMEPGNPNYEWRLASELLEDYARARRLVALAERQGKSARRLSSLKNTNLENQPFYWVLLTINPGSYLMEPIIAPTGVTSLAPLSSMVRESRVSAAINAGFFGVSGRNKGAPIGTLFIDNVLAGKPYQGRTCLGWSKDNRAAFGEVIWNGKILIDDGWLPIIVVNQYVKGDAVVLYNVHYGNHTPIHDNVAEIIVEEGRCVAVNTSGGTAVAPGRHVIAAYGTNAAILAKHVTDGKAVQVDSAFNDGDPHWNSMDNIIQAGPFLLRNGEVGIEAEGFSASILNLRHPRSVMGLTQDGKWFFFVGDGRDGMHSAGFTLQEVAVILKRKGAAYALNLDGGGSSQIMIDNKIFNSPSEKRERPISYGVGARLK